MIKLILVLLILMFSFSSYAQDCSDVIALSKITQTTIQNENIFTQNANNFCREYSRRNMSKDAESYGASYKFLSAAIGKSNARVTEIASKFCSATDYSQSSNQAYREYVEQIAPAAYSAYVECVRMSSNDVKFDFKESARLPTQFSVIVGFHPRSTTPSATITFEASDGVTCGGNRVNGNSLILNNGESTVVTCSRSNAEIHSYVVINREDGIEQSMTIPWTPYNSQGIPVNAVRNFYDTVADLNEQNKLMKTNITQLENNIRSAQNYIHLLQSRRNNATSEISSHDGYFGRWERTALCPQGQYVCGFRSRMESRQNDGDDTALNGIRLTCCRF